MYPKHDEGSGLYGYWGRGGWTIRPQFQYAHCFANGFAATQLADGRYLLIGADGAAHPLDEIRGGGPATREGCESFTGFDEFDSRPSPYAPVRSIHRGRAEWGLIDAHLSYWPLPGEVFSGAKTCDAASGTSYSSARRGGGSRPPGGCSTSKTCAWRSSPSAR